MSSSAACSICTPTEWHRVGAMGIAVRDAAKSVYEGRAQGPHITRYRWPDNRLRRLARTSRGRGWLRITPSISFADDAAQTIDRPQTDRIRRSVAVSGGTLWYLTVRADLDEYAKVLVTHPRLRGFPS